MPRVKMVIEGKPAQSPLVPGDSIVNVRIYVGPCGNLHQEVERTAMTLWSDVMKSVSRYLKERGHNPKTLMLCMDAKCHAQAATDERR